MGIVVLEQTELVLKLMNVRMAQTIATNTQRALTCQEASPARVIADFQDLELCAQTSTSALPERIIATRMQTAQTQ